VSLFDFSRFFARFTDPLPFFLSWLLALSGLSTLFTWGSICMCHIRFRKAWKVQGHSVEELPFTAMGGVWGSWLGFALVCLVLIAQFYIASCFDFSQLRLIRC